MTRTPPHLVTLILLTALTVISLNMFLPALPAMRAAFGVSEAVMGIAISGYMVCAAVLQLVVGPLSDRVGRRPVLLGALGLYVAASLVCVVTQDITVFLAARMVQAIAVGGGVLASAVVRDLYDGPDAAAKLSTIAAAMAVAPMLAPALGGIVDATLGWRAVFAVYAGLGGVLLALVFWDLGETRARAPAGGLAPYVALLRGRIFWAHAATMTFSVGAFYIFLTGAPFVAEAQFGLRSDQIGFGLGSITAGFMMGATISARGVARLGQVRLIFAGRALAMTGLTAGLVVFASGAGSVWLFFGATICVGIGNGLTISNAYAGALAQRPDLAGTAAGVAGALMLIGGAGLTALALAVLARVPSPLALLMLMIGSVLLSVIAALAAWGWTRAQGPEMALSNAPDP
ncbi:Bcr/CflA family efflux MFS transporter [Cognatishimia sp. F0-27]|uniref:Bcr/CflA family efflux MFS transporter n=1 Tax=Cognatishimia sp. F0-27 TaxID=2816855 RepID=UPI001D0C852F|nr:Bcr/CflA family efflux MFS transporter [Cognatishimia sp. F0-27]MCC1493434.1 Bcr/CflA family efflux MFS transporter [Cognatishimia sp. F0-27]